MDNLNNNNNNNNIINDSMNTKVGEPNEKNNLDKLDKLLKQSLSPILKNQIVDPYVIANSYDIIHDRKVMTFGSIMMTNILERAFGHSDASLSGINFTFSPSLQTPNFMDDMSILVEDVLDAIIFIIGGIKYIINSRRTINDNFEPDASVTKFIEESIRSMGEGSKLLLFVYSYLQRNRFAIANGTAFIRCMIDAEYMKPWIRSINNAKPELVDYPLPIGLTVIMGKSKTGKSTLLDALDAYYGDVKLGGVKFTINEPDLCSESSLEIINSAIVDWSKLIYNKSKYLSIKPPIAFDSFTFALNAKGNETAGAGGVSLEFLSNLGVVNNDLMKAGSSAIIIINTQEKADIESLVTAVSGRVSCLIYPSDINLKTKRFRVSSRFMDDRDEIVIEPVSKINRVEDIGIDSKPSKKYTKQVVNQMNAALRNENNASDIGSFGVVTTDTSIINLMDLF